MTTVIVTPTFVVPSATGSVSYSLYQGNGVNTASELASSALPTQLVFDTKAGGVPVGAATTGEVATMSVSPIFIGTADVAKSVVVPTTSTPTSDSNSTPTEAIAAKVSRKNAPVLAIVLALVAVVCISMMFLFLWYRKRTRRRGHAHGRAGSEEYGTGPPAGDVLRKLGPAYEKSAADPFSDAHAAEAPSDPFADPEKPSHKRTESDSFLNMGAPRAPYTHAPSASTGSTASGRARKREMEDARQRDMTALNDLVRALDQKERQAQAEGRDRRSLPPVELFKAALIR
ncbi:hypothetical protein B0J17DRAFT_626545 [Rhizoctonia solani]|nr:hypothetical protein B0J17DRAFT_626545 [Rhizoctonia solani]